MMVTQNLTDFSQFNSGSEEAQLRFQPQTWNDVQLLDIKLTLSLYDWVYDEQHCGEKKSLSSVAVFVFRCNKFQSSSCGFAQLTNSKQKQQQIFFFFCAAKISITAGCRRPLLLGMWTEVLWLVGGDSGGATVTPKSEIRVWMCKSECAEVLTPFTKLETGLLWRDVTVFCHLGADKERMDLNQNFPYLTPVYT